MIRNLQALVPALAVVLAMSAVGAPAALAQGKLTASEPVTQRGTETGAPSANQLSAFGVATRCPGSTYTGHQLNWTPHTLIPSGVSTATLTPEFKQTTAGGAPNCTVTGVGWTETFHMNGCDFVVNLGATTGGGGTYAVTFDLICPEGEEVTTTLWTTEALHTSEPNNPFCMFHLPEQSGLTGAHATNTSGGHVGIHGTITGITVTRSGTSHPLICSESTTNAAQLSLDITVKGENAEGSPVSIALSD